MNHQIHAGLVNSYRVCRSQDTDVIHAGVFCHCTAVTVYRKIFHNIDKSNPAFKMFHNAGGRIRHGFRKRRFAGMLIPGFIAVVCLSSGMNQGLARSGSTADRKLLQSSAVSAHGMSFKMSQDQHRIVILDIFPQMVFLKNLSMGNRPDHVRSFCIHEIHIKIFCPSMFFQKLQMGLCMIPDTAAGISISSVAFYNSSLDLLNHGPPEFRPKEILVSLFSGMDLHCHFSRQFHAKSLVHLNYLFRSDLFCKINFCLHIPFLSFLYLIIQNMQPKYQVLCSGSFFINIIKLKADSRSRGFLKIFICRFLAGIISLKSFFHSLLKNRLAGRTEPLF